MVSASVATAVSCVAKMSDMAETDASITGRIVATCNPGTSERASWLTTYSNLLNALGRRADSLAAINEAVTIYQNLARTRPSASLYRGLAHARPSLFNSHLARTLKDLSAVLTALGKRTQAETVQDEAENISSE
jgi:hypothetical protein